MTALAAFVLPGGSSGGTTASPPALYATPLATPSAPSPLQPLPKPSPPTALYIPALGVRAPVVPLQAAGEVLTPPGDVREVGWWSAGRQPGARHGKVLITGHTVHTGGGVFDNLGDLRREDQIQVDTKRGALVYRVVAVDYLSIKQLADRSRSLFATTGPSRLVLVTCAGWDGAAYHGNTVVIAKPVLGAGRAHGVRSEHHAHHAHQSNQPRSRPSRHPSDAATPSDGASAGPSTVASSPGPDPGAIDQTPAPALPSWYPCAACEFSERQRLTPRASSFGPN